MSRRVAGEGAAGDEVPWLPLPTLEYGGRGGGGIAIADGLEVE
jgi:hypothetical protein